MNRLEKWNKNTVIRFPEDIVKLKETISELKDIPDAQIQDMYSCWGESTMCASWLMLEYANLEEFRAWLLGGDTCGDENHVCECDE